MKKILLSIVAVLVGLSANAYDPANVTAKMAINLVATDASDYVSLVQEPSCSSAKEQYESNKIVVTDNASNVNVYALQEGTGWDDPKASIVMTDNLAGTPIVIVTNTTETSYKFTFSNVAGQTLKLWDKYTNVCTDIDAANEYAFTVSAAGRQTIADRFEIVNALPSEPTICHQYGKLIITGHVGDKVKVLDMEGGVAIAEQTIDADNMEIILSDHSLTSGKQYKVVLGEDTMIIRVQ